MVERRLSSGRKENLPPLERFSSTEETSPANPSQKTTHWELRAIPSADRLYLLFRANAYFCIGGFFSLRVLPPPTQDTLLYTLLMALTLGDLVPDLLGVDEAGQEVRLSDYPGRKIVLYFYPKDNTSGCTAQACSLRDGYSELRAAGYEIIGVSRDSAKSHVGFRSKYELPFRLIADTDVQLNELFGTWIEKSMYGRKYMGTERTTFVIGTDGRIERIIRGKAVNTKEHAQQILHED